MAADWQADSQIQSYQDLKVWKLGMQISKEIYQLTSGFPKHELYGLTSQIRRATTSIPANIAEGHGRSSTKDYLRHLSYAIGSLAECETFLILAVELNYTSTDEVRDLTEMLNKEGRMLRNLQKSLQGKVIKDVKKPR